MQKQIKSEYPQQQQQQPELESEVDESEIRRELLNDVSNMPAIKY